VTWASAGWHSSGFLAVSCAYPCHPQRPRAVVGPSLGIVDPDPDDDDDVDLRFPLGDAPVPSVAASPAPRIAAIKLSVAETARLTALAAQHAAGLITRVRLAFALRWSARRRRHQATARWHHHSTRLLAAPALTRPRHHAERQHAQIEKPRL
jgi:hypothetical protein